ncbi:T6SS immunity protein Tli4 family protein [Cupriavidus sp.]|uniref:T6SS immunity protein Tli4 family protein n=1 Tax=Cupriavidus sp. TaxID=1873897 RepID=UPI0028BD7E9C|nr:T6SS immunity protein Tli4 family protein [Cupriavidus sp.]
MQQREIIQTGMAVLAMALLVGCGPSRAEREETERAQEWLQVLQQAAHVAYTPPSSAQPQECLGRHVFSVTGPPQWPADSRNSYVFSLRHSYNVKEVNKMVIDDTRIAVISDPEAVRYLSHLNSRDYRGDRAPSEWRDARVAEWKADLENPKASPADRQFAENRLLNHALNEARARIDRRFDTGLPDSIAIWNSDYPELYSEDDPRRDNLTQTLTAYVYRKPWLHIFEQTGRADQPEANRARMRAFLKRFRARAEFEIPTEPGLCIPYAFLADDGTLPFRIKLSMRYPDALGVTYTFDMGYLTPDTEGGGPLFDSLGVAAIGITGLPANTTLLQRIARKAVIDSRETFETGVVVRNNGADEMEKYNAHQSYDDEQLERILNRPPYEVYTLYVGSDGKMNSQALPWLGLKMRTFARNQADELPSDPPPFAQSEPRFRTILESLRLRATVPALPEVTALGKGYGVSTVGTGK